MRANNEEHGEAASEPDVDMRKGRNVALVASISINLLPIVGVLFWSWDAFALIALYWLENLVIGARTVLSMLYAGVHVKSNAVVLGVPMAAFFTVHYGLFCFVHGVFVVSLFGPDSSDPGSGLFDLFGVMSGLFAAEPNFALGFLAIVAWQGVQFVLSVVRGTLLKAAPGELMGAPYPRILVLHFTILVSGAVVTALGLKAAGAVLLALIKTAFDVAEALGKVPKIDLSDKQKRRPRRWGRRGKPGV